MKRREKKPSEQPNLVWTACIHYGKDGFLLVPPPYPPPLWWQQEVWHSNYRIFALNREEGQLVIGRCLGYGIQDFMQPAEPWRNKLMTQLMTTLPCRLKLAPSSHCYPWLKSGSKCSHFTKATVKWDWCPRGWKGPHCVGQLLWCTIVRCLSRAFFPTQVCHLSAAHLWAPPEHIVSGQECCSLSPFTKPCRRNPFKGLRKSMWCLWLWDCFVLSNLRQVFVFFPLRWKW